MSNIRERNRRLIVEAAAAEFASKGFEASKVEDIAARAGLPKANLYYYFENKRDLYACVLDSVMEPILRAARSLDPQALPEQALQRYIRVKMRVVRQYPHACKALVREMLHGAQHVSGRRAETLRDTARQNLHCLTAWMDKGLITRTAPEHLLLFLWAMPMAHILVADQPGLTQPRGSSESTVMRIVLRGLRPEIVASAT
ncbi:MAG: TetR/AcrR family transcriptional regulator [Pseudomonas putida]|jgi:TetR/AcrR family transcriptional regulator|nr:TetR/AcrR family transcriptional regulator [Pseudomonas putida]